MASVDFNITVVHKNGTCVYNIRTTGAEFQQLLYLVQTGGSGGQGGSISKVSGSAGTGDEIGFSLTEGGNAVDLDTSIYVTVGGNDTTIYALYLEPETITGFFLDGQEYVLGGSGGGEWGTITGTLSDQTDLQTALNGKQATLSTQTAYTSKGTGQKVPQITTNNLGQVTNITEVNIDYPQIISDIAYGSSWNGDTTQAPSKNAVYDKISSMDTTITGKQETLVSGTNIKTINNTSLLGSGNIDIQSGGNYTAGEGISIGDATMNARKGPSPDGFHVPSKDEWQGLNTIMTLLSLTTGDGWRINLHMPFAGRRYRSGASIGQQGSYGYYWSSSPYGSSSPRNARRLTLISSYVYPGSDDNRAYGFSIRCFKDAYVAPDSNWTVVQGTLGSAGIFWNQSKGLISITNGSTEYTIMDKNLGATTVYNDGDTLTQANMGNMYQWGNNYGFPSTGTISNTSSTQVNASSYGPTNPYSSDTFITGNEDWSLVANDDLRGDTTGTYILNNAITNTGVLSVNGNTGAISNVVTGDNQYQLVVSSTAPSSGTASNIITIVTD